MIHRQRCRAIGLVSMIALVPVLAAVMLIGFQLTNQVAKLQGRETRLMADHALIHDLVRRIQRDTNLAQKATVRQEGDTVLLELAQNDKSVRYQVNGGEVARLEQMGSNPGTRYTWSLQHSQLDFEIEAVHSKAQIVWLKFVRNIPMDRGSDRIRQLSATAVIGRGGES